MNTQILQQTELLGRQFSVYGTPETPLFKAQDVATMLSLTNVSDMIQRVDEEERSKLNLGRQGEVWMLTEDGLYEVLMQSRKPIAKQFKKGVKTILKEIRTNGGYIAAQPEEDEASIMARALLVAQRTIDRGKQKLIEAQNTIEQQENTITQQNKKIETLQKDSDYLNQILQSKSTVTITQIAADYGMSAKALNNKLHELRIQHKVNRQWIPYAPFLNKGYVHSRTIHFTRSNGQEDTTMNTEWTQRGRIFLYETLKQERILPLIER